MCWDNNDHVLKNAFAKVAKRAGGTSKDLFIGVGVKSAMVTGQ